MIRIRDSLRIPGRVRVTYWLLILNVLSFMVTFTKMPDPFAVWQVGGLIPAEFFNPQLLDPKLLAIRPPAVITIFWSMFLHGGLFHLISNCVVLLIMGPNVEAQMGWRRFLLFYFACGAAGALVQVTTSLTSTVPVIGASGAISGLLGAYLVLFPDHYIRITIGPYPRNYRDIVIPVKVILLVWLISQLSMALLPGSSSAQGIAIFTHVGGFFCGFLLAGSGGIGSKRRFRVFTGGSKGGGPFGGTND